MKSNTFAGLWPNIYISVWNSIVSSAEYIEKIGHTEEEKKADSSNGPILLN